MTPQELRAKRYKLKFESVSGGINPWKFKHSTPDWRDLESLNEQFKAFCEEEVARASQEIVICAAIKLDDGRILRCHRHGDGMLNAHHNGWKLAEGMEQQGFVTSKGRYVSREEGRKLQDAAGIPSADKDGYREDTLFSEDLY